MKRKHWGAVSCATFLVLAAGCGRKAGDDAMETVQIYHLMKALPRGAIKTPQADYVRVVKDFAAAGEKRDVLFMHPDSSVEFPSIKISDGARLQFGFAMGEAVWTKEGDGAVFSVSIKRKDHAPTKIFTRHLDPQHRPEDRRWVEAVVPLQPFAKQEVQVILQTSPGPNGDARNDWAGWSDPMVVLPVP